MFGINGGEFLVLLVIAIIVVGPERLPQYTQDFRDWVTRGRDYVRRGQASLKDEFGADVDWATLDPRQYDPRRIVREALEEDPTPPVTARTAGPAASAGLTTGQRPPIDLDAT